MLVRLILCALVVVSPVPSTWTLVGAGDASLTSSAAATVATVVEFAEGHVIGSPAGGDAHVNNGEEEAALDADEDRVRTKSTHDTLFYSSEERTIRYPTYRPPRQIVLA